jgi:hypothetical protein
MVDPTSGNAGEQGTVVSGASDGENAVHSGWHRYHAGIGKTLIHLKRLI